MKKHKFHFTKKHGIIIASFAVTTIGMVAAAIVSGNSHPDGLRAGLESVGQSAQGTGSAGAAPAGGISLDDLNASLSSASSSYGAGEYPRAEFAPLPIISFNTSGGPYYLPVEEAAGPAASTDEDYPRVENPLLPQR